MVLCTDFGTFGSKICSFLSSTFNQISKQESDIRATPYCMAKKFRTIQFPNVSRFTCSCCTVDKTELRRLLSL